MQRLDRISAFRSLRDGLHSPGYRSFELPDLFLGWASGLAISSQTNLKSPSFRRLWVSVTEGTSEGVTDTPTASGGGAWLGAGSSGRRGGRRCELIKIREFGVEWREKGVRWRRCSVCQPRIEFAFWGYGSMLGY